jgi:alkylhydroperoxidase/carboxymuconolactone decarboxylase family protein YurZ
VVQLPENPLKVFERADPELLRLVDETGKFALAEGALSKKMKLLIAMALDAAAGAPGGVAALAGQARREGATNEEITEAIRVAQYVCGVGSVYAAAQGLKEIL